MFKRLKVKKKALVQISKGVKSEKVVMHTSIFTGA
jgi:hypothetical protein